ncbi:hypothetical protein [Streptomyces inhibens]|uniref:hypothetical protein n=1 Tax=Streptomyces inhibens TaxID=2293571 RepID=UPI001EE70116|nr:hypothetical protein [Streptomyces inhibens]UKY54750.1 hypothetical protein KI385_42175 [Streptomyces inhibens]
MTQIVPAVLGVFWLTALALKATAPCGPAAKGPATTIREHLRAMASHARSIAIIIAPRTGANDGKL